MQTTTLALAALWLTVASGSLASPDQETAENTLNRIQHVVVLCMENRSFDHMFGLFDHNPELDGLANYMNTTNAANIRDPNSRAVRVSRGSPYIAPVNPEHDVAYVTEQIFGTRRVRKPYPDPAPMNGFIQDNLLATKGNLETAGHVMQAFTPEQLPVLEQLAREYAVVDRWFSSVPGPTQPNRSFMHSGTAHGEVDNHLWHMRMGYPQKTIYQALSEVKKDWKIYYHDGPSAALFRWMRSPKNLLKLKSFTKNFAEDCREGKLPAYTFIDPQFFDRKKVLGMFGKNTYANDDHPPHDIRRGQDLIKDVYEAVRSSPQWESTLLIITYDEHGGYYDHVPPPSRGVPNPDGIAGDGINYDRLGVRVPTLMISPWIKKGTVFHSPPEWVKPTPTSQYEHSSIPATLHKLFGTNRFLTSRDRWAATLESMWSELSAPRKDTPVELNNAPPYQKRSSFQVDKEEAYNLDLSGPLTDMQEAVLESMKGMNGDLDLNRTLSKVEAADYIDQVMISKTREAERASA